MVIISSIMMDFAKFKMEKLESKSVKKDIKLITIQTFILPSFRNFNFNFLRCPFRFYTIDRLNYYFNI